MTCENDNPEKIKAAGGITPGRALSLGTDVAAGMGICVGLGYYIDYRRGDGGRAGVIIGALVGLLYVAYEFWKVISMVQRQADRNTKETESDETE